MTLSNRFSRPGKDECMRVLGACSALERDTSKKGVAAVVTAYGPHAVASAMHRRSRLALDGVYATMPKELRRVVQSSDLLNQMHTLRRSFLKGGPLKSSEIKRRIRPHRDATLAIMRMLELNDSPSGVSHALDLHDPGLVQAVLSVRFWHLHLQIDDLSKDLEVDQRQRVRDTLRLIARVDP